MSECDWIQVVSEVYSTSNYVPYQDEVFEQNFTIDYEDDRPIRLLRIDIVDRFYLKEFKLIYMATEETIEGHTLGDHFLFRYVWEAKKGKYKIVSRGGKYRYSVFMLESTLKFTREPICVARSPFNILAGTPTKDKALYKHVAYRKVGTTEWIIAEPSVEKVSLDVEPTSAYEVKMKLFMPHMFETEYSPTIITTVHQSWANEFEPDLDFFNTTLVFQIKTRIWLDNISIALKCTSESVPEKCWMEETKQPPPKTEKWKSPRDITWELDSRCWGFDTRFYDILVNGDVTLDWQLVFTNTKTDQISESNPRKFVLQKRQKILRGESLRSTMVKFDAGMTVYLYLCGDGQFWFRRHNYSEDLIAFKGNFILERKDPKAKKCNITLFPKFKKINQNNTEVDQLSRTLLPELVAILLSYVGSPPHFDNKLKSAVSMNLVCKHWFNIFADGLLQIPGELEDNYLVHRRSSQPYPLNFFGWTDFRLSRDNRLLE